MAIARAAAARGARASFAPPASAAAAWRSPPPALRACSSPPTPGTSPAPSSLTTTDVTPNAASLSWTSGNSAVAKVSYAPAAGGTGALPSLRTAVGGRVRLRGLTPSTTYAVRVAGLGGEPLAGGRFVTVAEADALAGAGAAAQVPAAAEGDVAPVAAAPAPVTELSRLEFRVGVINSVSVHPEADGLYVEEVDVGEEAPRTIVSGLVAYQPAAALLGRRVVVVANLKPRVMRGIASAGMLLCASDDGKGAVEPLAPPEGAALGDLVTFEGHASAPVAPGNRASKAFDRIVGGLRTNEDGVAVYEAPGGEAPPVPFAVGGGFVVSPSKIVGTVS